MFPDSIEAECELLSAVLYWHVNFEITINAKHVSTQILEAHRHAKHVSTQTRKARKHARHANFGGTKGT